MKPLPFHPPSVPLIGLSLALCITPASATDWLKGKSQEKNQEPYKPGKPDPRDYCHDRDKDPEPGCTKKCTRVDYEDCKDDDKDRPHGDKDCDDRDKGGSKNDKDCDKDEKTRRECEALEKKSKEEKCYQDDKKNKGQSDDRGKNDKDNSKDSDKNKEVCVVVARRAR